MKVVAAFLLAVLGGNPSPSAEDIDKILASVGADAESDRTELLLSQLQDRDIGEVMAAGRQQLASVPAAAGAGVSVAVSSSGGAAAAAADAPEPKKEEKVEEKEESDEDMGFSLFD